LSGNTYPAYGGTRPHAATAYTTTTNGNPTTTSQTWTAPGQLATRTTNGTNTTYNWNASGATPGQLAAITGPATTNYRYDAAGEMRVVQDGSTTTLYLPDEELTANGSTVTATRHYTLGGQTIAARTPASLTWLLPDIHGTSTAAIDTTSQNITLRNFTPFGAPIGTQPASWPGTHGFVGGTTDTTTGLTNLGAREYNPAAPAFIAPDPVLDTYTPSALDPYDYATNNPEANSDPTGLSQLTGGGGTSSCTSHPSDPGCNGNPGGGDDNGGGTIGGCTTGCPTSPGGCANGCTTSPVSTTPPVADFSNLKLALRLPDLSNLSYVHGTCYDSPDPRCSRHSPFGEMTWEGWTEDIGWASSSATGLALATAWIPGVDVATGALAVATDALAAGTNIINTGVATVQGHYKIAAGYLASAALSATGAGVGGKAVTLATRASTAERAAGTAGRSFGRLDHALPEGSPQVRAAAETYFGPMLGTYQVTKRSAALWGRATLAVALSEAIAAAIALGNYQSP
jgi:RHS repeat-associated protein